MREIQESVIAAAGAIRRGIRDYAFIDIDRTRVKMGRAPGSDCSQRQVVRTLRCAAAAKKIAAIGDSEIGDSGPGRSSVHSAPNSTVSVILIYIPNVHLSQGDEAGTIGNDRDFAAINWAAARQGGLRRAEGRAQDARLRAEPDPCDP